MSGDSPFYPPVSFPGQPGRTITPFPRPGFSHGYQNGNRTFELDPEAEPMDLLLAVMRDPNQPIERRIDAAKAAAPYRHVRLAPAMAVDQGGMKIEISGGLPQDEAKTG